MILYLGKEEGMEKGRRKTQRSWEKRSREEKARGLKIGVAGRRDESTLRGDQKIREKM